MDKLEKVINGLECCIADGYAQECEECPYALSDGTCDRLDPMLRDALELLKAQEPRVMTLEELSTNGNDDVIYIETALFIDGKRVTKIKPAIFQPDNCSPEEDGYYCIVSSWGNSGFYHEENYGFDWRCWTSRPDDERRQNTPWERLN